MSMKMEGKTHIQRLGEQEEGRGRDILPHFPNQCSQNTPLKSYHKKERLAQISVPNVAHPIILLEKHNAQKKELYELAFHLAVSPSVP